ncbi:MAG: nuclease-related domain-containing protein [Acidiferrobacterales bacterium]
MTAKPHWTTADGFAWVQELREVIGPREQFEEREAKKAGDNAEQELHAIVRSKSHFGSARIFENKRVPLKNARSRRGEIDLLVMTERRLYVLEVKNWSGRLDQSSDGWLYTPRVGAPRQEQDWIAWNRTKADGLREYLKDQGVDIAADAVVSRMVFMNERIELDRAIADNQDVIARGQLEMYFNKQPGAYGNMERLLASLIEWLFSKEREAASQGTLSGMSQATFKKACDSVAGLQTFDRVVLQGGRELPGDLHALSINGDRWNPDWPSGTELVVRWPRSLWSANRILWRAVVAGERPMWGIIETPTALQRFYHWEGVRFQEAGQVLCSWVPFQDIDRIVIG